MLAWIVLLLSLLHLQPTPQPATAAPAIDWIADLDFLSVELPKRHKNAFFHIEESAWRKRAEELRAELPSLSPSQSAARFRQLVALVGDGHTTMYWGQETALPRNRPYPIAVAWLADGVYVAVLPEDHRSLIGAKLTQIDDTPIEQVIERLATLRAFDNESGRKNNTMADLRDAESLAALGIVADMNAAKFTIAPAENKRTTITLAPMDPSKPIKLAQVPDPSTFPEWRRNDRPPHGCVVVEEKRTLFVWYDTCSDTKTHKVSAFTTATLKALDEALAATPPKIDRVVIDLRRNGGGNSMLFMPMIDALSRRDAINKPGHLYALIGRRTFSSAMMNAYQLRNATKCILMGEPTGGGPNGYGEVKTVLLPSSKLVVQYSTKLFRGAKEDTDAVYPHVMCEADSASYFAGRDLVLDRAMSDAPPQ